MYVCVGTYLRGSTTEEGPHPRQRLRATIPSSSSHTQTWLLQVLHLKRCDRSYTNPPATNTQKLRTEMGFPISIFACSVSPKSHTFKKKNILFVFITVTLEVTTSQRANRKIKLCGFRVTCHGPPCPGNGWGLQHFHIT